MSKVIFWDVRKTKTIELPSFPGSEVVVFTELNIGQQRFISNAGNDFERGMLAAQTAIKSWNLFQDENTPLEISQETFKQFSDRDMIMIFATIAGKTVEEFSKITQNPSEEKKSLAVV